MDTQRKYEIIGNYIKTASGRQRLAATMIQPLRERRDYTAVGRKAFYVEQLPDGAVATYDKDPNVTAYYIGEEGDNIVAVAKSKRIQVPLFEIASNPEIPLTEIKARRFDLVERAVDKGKSEIQAQEDTKIFATIDAGLRSAVAPNPIQNVTGNLTANALADAFALIETNDVRVANVFLNAKDYADLRKWDRDTLDVETQAVLLKTGLMGTIWGARLIVSRIVPQGTVYCLGEPEFLGRIPVRTELTVLSADNPKARLIGFSMFEQIGVGFHFVQNGTLLQIARV